MSYLIQVPPDERRKRPRHGFVGIWPKSNHGTRSDRAIGAMSDRTLRSAVLAAGGARGAGRHGELCAWSAIRRTRYAAAVAKFAAAAAVTASAGRL